MSATESAFAGAGKAVMPYLVLGGIIGAVWLFRDQIAGWFRGAVTAPITEAVSGAVDAVVTAGQGVNDRWGISGPDTPISGDPNRSVLDVLINGPSVPAGQTSYEFGGNITPWAASGETGHFGEVLVGFSPTITPFVSPSEGTPFADYVTANTPPVAEVPENYVSPAESSGLLDSLRAAAQSWKSGLVFAADLPDLYAGEGPEYAASGSNVLFQNSGLQVVRTPNSIGLNVADPFSPDRSGWRTVYFGNLYIPVPDNILSAMGLI